VGGGRWRGAISGRWDHWATTIPHRRTPPPPGTDEQRRSRRRGGRSLRGSRLAWRDRETPGRQDKKRPKEPFEAEQPGREATLLPSGGGCRSWNDGSCDSPSPEPRKQDRDCSRCLPSRSLAPSGKENDSLRPPGRQGSYPRTSRHASEIVHEVPADPPRAVDNCPPSWWRPTAIPAGAARRQRCPSAATFARPPCSPRRGLPPAARYGREASL
jgi:hypothetical protein